MCHRLIDVNRKHSSILTFQKSLADHIVQLPEGVTLQKYPPTRLLMILVEEVV